MTLKDNQNKNTSDLTAAVPNWSDPFLLSILGPATHGIMISNKAGIVEFLNEACIKMFGTMDVGSTNYINYICAIWRKDRFNGIESNARNEDEFRSIILQMIEKSLDEPQIIKLPGDRYFSFDRYYNFYSRYIEGGCRLFTFTDITQAKLKEIERDQARLQSEHSLADFNVAIDNMDVGLVLLDRSLNTLIINDAFNVIWNTDADSFPKGTNFRNLMDANRDSGIYDVEDENWEEYVQMRLAEVRAGDIAPREFGRADGKILIYSCIALSGGQRLVRYSDITEFKQREEALEEAQLRASAADKSKSEFLANMSHEIRTPMNGVMGMAELLSNTEMDSRQKMFTDVILTSSAALLTIINDILDFSKIEAGKLALDCASFCLSRAIEDVATLVSTNADERDVELIVRIQPDLVDYVVGDVGRFRQILTNLMGNAVKFTEAGHVLVDVSGKLNAGSVELKCSVQDTGIGIPEEQIKTIFEKFSQVDGSSTRRHEGTGLGLAISSRLVDLMGGNIGCESTLGEGSTFWFTAQLPIDTNVRVKSVHPVDIAGAKLLAIDDNAVNRSILLEQFEYWRMNGEAAASGLEGLAMLRQSVRLENPFDAVVLDYHMPDMNGLDVARVIRSDDALKHCAIIMLTSVDNISDSAEFKALNIDAHLTKPARASHLLESIVDVLSDAKTIENFNFLTDSSADISETEKEKIVLRSLVADSVPVQLPCEKGGLIITRPPDRIEMSKDAAPKKCAAVRAKPYILVAEDNDVNQMVFRQVLQHLGYDFKIVENGQLALEEVSLSQPEIVLMDVSMPVMSGLDATQEIRKLDDNDCFTQGYRPIIIGITAHALKEDEARCLASGMDDYMSKPISPKILGEKISHWLSLDVSKRITG